MTNSNKRVQYKIVAELIGNLPLHDLRQVTNPIIPPPPPTATDLYEDALVFLPVASMNMPTSLSVADLISRCPHGIPYEDLIITKSETRPTIKIFKRERIRSRKAARVLDLYNKKMVKFHQQMQRADLSLARVLVWIESAKEMLPEIMAAMPKMTRKKYISYVSKENDNVYSRLWSANCIFKYSLGIPDTHLRRENLPLPGDETDDYLADEIANYRRLGTLT